MKGPAVHNVFSQMPWVLQVGKAHSEQRDRRTAPSLAPAVQRPKNQTRVCRFGWVINRERAFALQVSSLKATRSTLGQVVGGARGTEGVSCHPETLWVNSTHFLSAAAKDCMFPSEKDSCGILCLSSGERLSWVVSAKGRPKFSNWFSPYAHRCVRC